MAESFCGVMAESCALTADCLYYMRARYYEPKVGRFISEDPIGFEGGTVNLYEYVGGNPVNAIDPLGLDSAGGDKVPTRLKACCPAEERQAINDRIDRLESGSLGESDYGSVYCWPLFGPTEPKINQFLSPCVKKCVEVHENVHRQQCNQKGAKYYRDPNNVASLDKEAYQAELDCLKALLK